MNDEFYMDLAINKAWKYQLLIYPNPAVGCAILNKNGKLLSVEAHEKAGFPHAELNAVKSALIAINPNLKREFENLNANELYEKIISNFGGYFCGAKAYVTLEPCSHQGRTPPCATLLSKLGFSEICIGMHDKSEKASGGANILRDSGANIKFGICEERCYELLEPFLAWSSGNFTFFKLAMSANGVISGGTISSQTSRAHMHEIRSLVDLLVVGGNTIRTDRPILDSRLSNSKKNPNVLIFSKNSSFDTEIPLFKVKERSVKISNSLDPAFEVKFAMIEGGENLLDFVKDKVKWLSIYKTSEFKDANNARINLKTKIMHEENIGEDRLIWSKILR